MSSQLNGPANQLELFVWDCHKLEKMDLVKSVQGQIFT